MIRSSSRGMKRALSTNRDEGLVNSVTRPAMVVAVDAEKNGQEAGDRARPSTIDGGVK